MSPKASDKFIAIDGYGARQSETFFISMNFGNITQKTAPFVFMTAFMDDAGNILACAQGNTLQYSDDQGDSWTQVYSSINPKPLRVYGHSQGKWWVSFDDNTMGQSDDGGVTWTFTDWGSFNNKGQIFHAAEPSGKMSIDQNWKMQPASTILDFDTNTGVENFRVGDDVEQDDSGATGKVIAVTDDTLSVSTVSGNWVTNGTRKVVGPLKKGTGTISSISGLEITITGSNDEWLANSDIRVVDPLNPGAPGAPAYVPQDGYVSVIPSSTTLTTAVLDSGNLTQNKAYYSRIKYFASNGVSSDFSEFHEFTTKEVF